MTGIFPSDLFSVFTVPIVGLAVRHEFIIIYTYDFLISLEIFKQDNEVVIVIRIFKINWYDKK